MDPSKANTAVRKGAAKILYTEKAPAKCRGCRLNDDPERHLLTLQSFEGFLFEATVCPYLECVKVEDLKRC